MELSPSLNEYLTVTIPAIAADAHRSHRTIPAEDIEQSMWETAVRKADKLAGLLQEGKTWSVRRILEHGAQAQLRADERYRRAKRALILGYSPDDEYFYSIGVLGQLIPLYLDGGVAEAPPKGREMSRGGNADEHGNYLAMMLDIDHAMSTVSRHHRQILERYYAYPQGSGGWTHEEISSALGINPEACRQRVYRARRAVQRELGGASPWQRRERGEQASGDTRLRRGPLDAGSGRA